MRGQTVRGESMRGETEAGMDRCPASGQLSPVWTVADTWGSASPLDAVTCHVPPERTRTGGLGRSERLVAITVAVPFGG